MPPVHYFVNKNSKWTNGQIELYSVCSVIIKRKEDEDIINKMNHETLHQYILYYSLTDGQMDKIFKE